MGKEPMYVRKPGIIEKSLDDEVLLIDEVTDSIFNLNQLGTAVWNLLQEPKKGEEIIDVLTTAFQDIPSEIIIEDTNQLLNRLVDKGLLQII